ncbi:hypothetical protein FB567DRAFT_326835 [Paraphoma chrysanthemicola]|uniref:Uncharacterized protein n=1 Tax=Paraphoma chrysanthemicola TaxID=798071 RepID=A0A8K0RBQ1_9PLEO|nr:hypothetical protein FB567DRAFT_326835 [Paraphoma chrysanthemicola]
MSDCRIYYGHYKFRLFRLHRVLRTLPIDTGIELAGQPNDATLKRSDHEPYPLVGRNSACWQFSTHCCIKIQQIHSSLVDFAAAQLQRIVSHIHNLLSPLASMCEMADIYNNQFNKGERMELEEADDCFYLDPTMPLLEVAVTRPMRYKNDDDGSPPFPTQERSPLTIFFIALNMAILSLLLISTLLFQVPFMICQALPNQNASAAPLQHRAGYLTVTAASIYYETYGSGPLLLFISGANGDANI